MGFFTKNSFSFSFNYVLLSFSSIFHFLVFSFPFLPFILQFFNVCSCFLLNVLFSVNFSLGHFQGASGEITILSFVGCVFPCFNAQRTTANTPCVVVAGQRAWMLSAQSQAKLYTDLRTCNRPMIMTVIDDHGSSARKRPVQSRVRAWLRSLLLRRRNQRVSGSDLLRLGTRENGAA